MKKFFALMLSVAMLLVAGSAMAASPVVTVSATSLTVKAGTSTQLTVSATAGNTGGTLGALKVSGASWATLSGNTLTLAPAATVAEGQYNIAVGVIETYTTSGAGGHGSVAMTASDRAVIAVSVLPADATGTVVVTKVTEVVTTVTKSVTIISSAARESAVVETFEEVTRTVTETITTTVLEKVKGFTASLISVWTAPAKVAAVETKKNAVTSTLSNTAGRANVFQYSKVPASASEESFKPKENNLLQPATSSVSSDATPEEKLAAATSALSGNDKKALSAGDAVKPTESGTFTFPKTFGKDLFGTKIGGSRNRQNRSRVNAGSFTAAAAADDEEGVAFVNSSGDIVDTIPDDSDPDNIMPGFVNMLVVMEANEVYEPVVYATTAALASNDISVDSRPVEVTVVDTVVEETKEVVVDVNADGSVSEETVVEKADSTTESSIAAAMGANTVTMVPADSYGAKVSDDALLQEAAVAISNDLHIAATLGRPFENLGTGTYYYVISFDALPSARTLASGATFEFYPDGLAEGTTAYAMIFDEKGNEVTTPSSIFGKTGIVAFEINSDSGIRTSNFDNTLANPTVAIKMNPIGGGGDESGDVEISRLRTAGYINASNVLQSAAYLNNTVPTFATSGDNWVMTVALKADFPVDSWNATCGGTALTASAITGTITKLSDTSARVSISKSSLTTKSPVVLTMHPANAAAGNNVTASGWNVSPDDTSYDYGVGSSSSGCSAGSSVLALALLGAFIAARKK